jgi:hypothetical protein
MGRQYGKNRPSEKRESGHIRDFESDSGIMGSTSTISRESRNDEIRVSGESGQQADTASTGKRSSNGVTGEIVRQLIQETERQLAYHKTQTSELEIRLQELHQLDKDFSQDEKNQEQE